MAIYIKSENLKTLNDISNIVNSLILSLSANVPFHESLKISINSIRYIRFKEEYKKFVDNYIVYNFDMIKAVEDFQNKFNSYEFKMFLSILIDCEKDGNLLENLEIFSQTLDIIYFKYLKSKSAKRIIYVSLATVVSLINILFLVMYPIIVSITSNMENIFK